MKKVVFLGLDDAGKTSIILTLKRELSKIAYLKPTKGIERRVFDFFGESISEHDLGGQSTYRVSYLTNPDKYLDDTSICIYTIDIQNEDRILESLEYFRELLKNYIKLGLSPTIHVFLHKHDPQMVNYIGEFERRCNDIKENLMDGIHYDKLYFHKTSIYDFASLIKKMSEIFLEIHPKAKIINSEIKILAESLDAEGIILLDDNSLIIGEYFCNEDTKKIFYASTPYFLTLNDSLITSEQNFTNPAEEMIIENFNKFFLFKQMQIDSNELAYYLIVLKNDNNFDDALIQDFRVTLRNTIKRQI